MGCGATKGRKKQAIAEAPPPAATKVLESVANCDPTPVACRAEEQPAAAKVPEQPTAKDSDPPSSQLTAKNPVTEATIVPSADLWKDLATVKKTVRQTLSDSAGDGRLARHLESAFQVAIPAGESLPSSATAASAAKLETAEPQHPLHAAASKGDVASIQRCCQNGADVNGTSEGSTALHFACNKGHSAGVQALLDARADVNARNCNGEAALHHSAQQAFEECLRVLIAAGADVNAQDQEGQTPLHWTARMSASPEASYDKVTKMLVDAGADVNAKSGAGYTPLAMSQDCGSSAISDILAGHGGSR